MGRRSRVRRVCPIHPVLCYNQTIALEGCREYQVYAVWDVESADP